MEVFDLIYYITLVFIPVAPYFLFFKQREENRFYTKRDWVYLIKYFLAKSAIKKQKKDNTISLSDKSLEDVTKIQPDDCDYQFIYGADQKGNNVYLKFTIRTNLVAELFICLRLANGAIYTFPDEVTKLCSIGDWKWKSKDLNFDILEPFKRVRITFNGLLKNKEKKIEHVQLNLIFTAVGAPQLYPQDAATELLADVLARQTWRDGNWLSLLGDQKGYEQFGSLRGFIKGDSFEEDQILSLPSARSRFFSTDEKLAVEKSCHLFIIGKDGTLINLWMKNLKEGCKELQYGSVVTNNGKIFPITNSDLRLDWLNNSAPSCFLVNVTANRKVYRTVFHLSVKKQISCDVSDLSNIPADCDLNNQQGKCLIEFWQCPKKTRSAPPPLLIENKTKTLPNCYVTSFKDDVTRIVRLTGGKGCSLATLASIQNNDFSVPDGFVVTVNALNVQLERNFNLKKSVSILEDICYGRVKGDLERACAETVKIFTNEPILPEVKSAILKQFKNIKSEVGFAVRSSAIGEDSEELSAAGQNETFLGCLTDDDVTAAVASCWASLYSLQSVKYRHQHGLPVASQMAVVVQKMVPAECAGVLFTCHPSTGNPAHIVITANHGLGESVVSGRSEPDTVIINKNNLKIQSKSCGSKKIMIKLKNGGTEEVEGMAKFSISDEEALLLARIGVSLEEKFGGARDIEWAFHQGRLYLLQARPITTLNAWTNYELLHEFDVATLSDDVIYTTANTGEILPGAVSALTFSTVMAHLDVAIQVSINNMANLFALRGLAVFQHHMFIDVISGLHLKVGKVVDLVAKSLDLAIVGHPIINEKIHSLSVSRNGITTPFDKLKDTFTMIKLAYQNEEKVKMANDISKTNIDIDVHHDTLKDIYAKIDSSLKTFTDLAYIHCFTTRVSVTYQIIALTTLVEKEDDFNVDHYNDAAMLLASCDDVISAEIPNILANITEILVKKEKAQTFVKIDAMEGRQWLEINVPEAAAILDKFLRQHGHRGVGEFDLLNPPWSMNPIEVIKMIQTNCKMTTFKHEKKSTSVDEVIKSLVSPKKNSTKTVLKFIMKKSRKAVGLREKTKSETIRFVNKIRIAYKTLSEKMALSGLIPDPALIYHLTHYEVYQIIDGAEQSPALINKAFKRKNLYPKWNQLKFPEVCYGVPKYENRQFIPRTGSGEIKCVGTPVCMGVVQARACVITDLKNIDQLKEGDVLITYCTDIGWSPYFPILGGIVTELGGLVSHGAVIAREYGLPCIVGAEGATKIFKTGDNVILSGKTGTIELV